MKLIKISKAGNLYFTMSDGRTGIVYPNSGYARIQTSINSRLYQINKKVVVYRGKTDFSYKRVLEFNASKLLEMLFNYDVKNCRSLQA